MIYLPSSKEGRRESKDTKGRAKSTRRGSESDSSNKSDSKIREQVRKHLDDLLTQQQGALPFLAAPSSSGYQQQQTPAPRSSPAPTPPPAPTPAAACNENKDDSNNNNNDTNKNQGEARKQEQEQRQVDMDTSREIRIVQDTREWPPLANGEHPKLEEIRDAYPEIPKGHVKLLLLWAIKSDFGYWL